MIHLDTNYLIGLLVKGSSESGDVDTWLAGGQTLAASAIAWTEFLNGPVAPLEVSRAEAVLQSLIVPFGKKEAALAAELFNQTGTPARLSIRLFDRGNGDCRASGHSHGQPIRLQGFRAARSKACRRSALAAPATRRISSCAID
jgi:hypothetical protein